MTLALNLVEHYAGLKSLARIAEAMVDIAKSWADKLLNDDEYSMLSSYLHLKQKTVRDMDTVAFRMPQLAAAAKATGFVSFFPKKKRIPKSPDREASQERRKMLASLGALPSSIARQFTIAEQAVLKIVADEVKRKGMCTLYLGEIAARAGVCLTTARDTIREASYMGKITIQERKQYRKPHLSNIVRIICAEWREWIFSRLYFMADFLKPVRKEVHFAGGASRKVGATDKGLSNPNGKAASRPYFDTRQPSG